jgi:hypothetical protein
VEAVVWGEAEYELARRGRKASYAICIEDDNRTPAERRSDEWDGDPCPPA